MDKIFVEGLSIQGKHGVYAKERRVEQEFLIDILAEFDSSAAGESDKLKDTLDYTKFQTIAEEVIASSPTYLIEKLGAKIGDRILEDARITSVSVTIRKPAALKNGVPGVTITRKKG